MVMHFRELAVLAVAAFAGLSLSNAAQAQETAPETSWTVFTDEKPRPQGELTPDLIADPALLEQYVDNYVGGKMDEKHLVGAVFMAIKDGEIVVQKGYGVKNLETQEPIDPEKTMFYVASISKTFLSTATMRLIDTGKLSLDDKVAEKAPSIKLDRKTAYKDQPLTIRDVLTHRSGFRDLMLNGTAPTEDKWERIRPVIRNYLTKQGARPGEFYIYCNICISMAAAVIEDVTGQYYEDWLQEQVFDPLGIKYATLVIPGNERVKKFDAEDTFVTPYVYNDKTGEYDSYGRFIRNLYPPSAVAISANGIKNFMLMHMNGGRHDGKQFLSPESFAEMHRHQGGNHRKIPGYRLPFKEARRNGVVYYGHSGDYRGNDSTMQFFPGQGFAFFLSYTGDNDTFYREFLNDFIDTAFPRQQETVASTGATQDDLKKYEGSYTNFRYDEPTPMQLVWPTFGEYNVTAEEGGVLRIKFPGFYFKGGTVRYVPTEEDGLFRKIDEGEPNRIGELLVDYLVFKTDKNGKGASIASNLQNHNFVLTRLPAWHSTNNFKSLMAFINKGLLAVLAVFGVIIVARLIAQFAAKKSLEKKFLASPAMWSMLIAAGAALWFLTVFFQTIFTTLPINLTYGLDDLGLTPYFALPLISVVGAFIGAVLAARAWLDGNHHSLLSKIVLTAALAPLGAWATVAANTNLLSYYFS